MWIPFFGWFTVKGRHDPGRPRRGRAGDPADAGACARGARRGPADHHFPGGHAARAGAEPAYKFGIARLYAELDAPCVPIALNSGLFWPRRKFLRYPGTIVVEILDPIPPGLDAKAFFQRLQDDIERATTRLIEEGRRDAGAATAPASAAA